MAVKNNALIEHLKVAIAEREAQRELERTGQWSWVGFSGIGAGVLGLGLIGGTIYLNSSVSTEINDISLINDPALYAQRREEIRTDQSTGQVLLYSGIGLAALGGSAIVWDLVSPGESPFSVRVNPTNSGLGFSVAGVF